MQIGEDVFVTCFRVYLCPRRIIIHIFQEIGGGGENRRISPLTRGD
jgi:hypothetical protein